MLQVIRVLGIVLVACIIQPKSAAALQVSQLPAMPNLTGKTLREAALQLRTLRLRITSIDTLYAPDTVNAGRIVGQKPSAKTPVQPGTAVSVTIKQYRPVRPRLVIVPDVRGLMIDAARDTLKLHALSSGPPTIRDRFDVPGGMVLDQKPLPGDSVRPGTPVSVLIASDSTVVPLLQGSSEQNAKALLSRYTLVLGNSNPVPSAAAAPGIIIGQKPPPRTRVPKNTAVTIDVATLVPDTMVVVPRITQLHNTAAAATLAGVDLQLRVIDRSDAANEAAGIVISQTPAAGDSVARKSFVDVVLATDSTMVPALVGHTLRDARVLVANAGLSITVPVTPVDEQSTIATQTPDATTRVPKRSAVSVTLQAASVVPPPPAPGPFPWLPVAGGFLAGALVVAGALQLMRRKPLVAEPILEPVPLPLEINAELPDGELAWPFTLALAGALDEQQSTVELSYPAEFLKEKSDE